MAATTPKTLSAPAKKRAATEGKARKAAKSPAKQQAPKQVSKKQASKKQASKKQASTKQASKKQASTKRVADKRVAKPKLLAGGNPQIPKGEGDAPVQAYIAAMPGWKRATGRRIDAIVEGAVPGVRKAVKWNSPFYGAPGDEGWFLSFHVFTRYVKATFFRGTSLRPQPPGESKHEHVRYLDIHEDGFDEARFADWVAQASRLPGERP